MILRLAIAELRNRPGRALFLLGGYALGVAVMVVLLAVGEAMLEQARDRALVGGGDVVLVPAGVSTEMLKAGGVYVPLDASFPEERLAFMIEDAGARVLMTQGALRNFARIAAMGGRAAWGRARDAPDARAERRQYGSRERNRGQPGRDGRAGIRRLLAVGLAQASRLH